MRAPESLRRQPASRERSPAERERLRVELESLVRERLRALVREAHARGALAWILRDPEWQVVAASPSDPAAKDRTPPRATLDALARLERASELASSPLPPSEREGLQQAGLEAAAPIRDASGTALGIVLLREPERRAGSVAPRALAALGAAAEALAAPLATGRTLDRLARLDADVRHLDRLAGLGALLGEIVHEVRNSLVSLETFFQLFPQHADDPEFREGFAALARDELARAERLLAALLEQARPPRAAARGPADAAAAVATVVRLLAQRAAARGVELKVETSDDLPRPRIAPDALRQVLLNLVMNALEATPNGGDVRIRTRRLATSLEIAVEDRGPGIPPELRERVFEPFFSTKAGASGGLGLAISRRIVEEAGGTLVALGRHGGGAVLRLRLPIA